MFNRLRGNPLKVRLGVLLLGAAQLVSANPSASLSQGGNGSFTNAVSPVNWQNGNANENNSHYFEGESIPYRLVITGLSPGTHNVVLEWDIRNSSEMAIDYVTHFQRIAETVNPLSGLSGNFGPPVTVAIPTPIPSLNVSGLPQPQSSFAALAPSEKLFTIYNGSIVSLNYVNNSQGNLGDLSASASSSDLQINFTCTNSTVVLAWGGHIASRLDWGVGNSAAGISGSPYHTRLISVDGSGGSQDRSLKAAAVCITPTNSLSGPASMCAGTTSVFTDQSDGTIFNWSLSGNASFVGPTTNSSVTVRAGSSGSFNLTVTAASSSSSSLCSASAAQQVLINPLPACSIQGPMPVCPGSTNNLYLAPPGLGSYVWSIQGNGVIAGAANGVSVSVSAGTNCGTTFTLGLSVVSSNGCMSACTQTIPIGDLSVPTFTNFPPDTVVECPGDTSPASTGTPIGIDSCTFSLSYQDFVTGGNCSNHVVKVIGRTWTLMDACGNTSNQTQIITVQDTTPPSFVSFPADAIVECPNSTSPLATGQPVGTDTCSSVSISYSDITVDGGCSNHLVATISRTWTLTDACGNTSNQTQVITVKDTTPPTFVSFPADAIVECPNSTSPLATGQPVGTDTCSSVSISYADITVDGGCSNHLVATISRTWTLTDACGNTSNQTQVITVKDTTPPSFASFPADAVVECPNSTSPDMTGQPVGTDTCSSVSMSYADVTVDGGCSNHVVKTISRTWTLIDGCGNSSNQVQTITVKDTTPPSFVTFPTNAIVECPNSTTPDATGQPTGTDTCSSVWITFTDAVVGGNSNQIVQTITRTWTLTDACGNISNLAQIITLRDTTPPVVTCQSNITVAESPRDSGGAVVSFAAAVATDTCDPGPLVMSSPPSGAIFPVGSNTVVWTAADRYGNTNACTFNIKVVPFHLGVTSTADSGPGTLRQALLDANGSPDQHIINFKFPGNAPFVIHLLSALPEVTGPVVIDGWTQSGSNGAPVVALDGSGASNAIDGLVLTAPSNAVRGLVLSGFATALRLQTNGFNTIQGNFIGTDSTGTNALGNSGDGIYVSSAGNLLGGLQSGLGNVISVNSNGIEFASANAVSNIVEGNFIGTGGDGKSALGNTQNGIRFSTQASANLIGGTVSNAANVIADNGSNGVTLTASAGLYNSILGNSIVSNGALGIDLGDDGVTLNGTANPNGPNAGVAFPVLTNALSINGITSVSGQYTGAAFTAYRIEFFLNESPDPSGYGEGQMFMGSIALVTDASGNASFSTSFPVPAVYTQFATATATDPAGNTSEFSQAIPVNTPPVIDSQPVGTNDVVGTAATFCARVSGTPPIYYQWRLNGWNIPGATNACYTIPAAEIDLGGTYTVLVENSLGALATIPVTLTLALPNVPAGDMFAARVPLSGTNGIVTGNNVGATVEPGEPLHDGQPGGHSVWYSWVAPVTGVVGLQTVGSTFDTILAVYTGNSVSNLTPVAADSDSGGFYTSALQFNAFKGQEYEIAIDGFGGAQGDFVFSWQELIASHMLPIFLVAPVSQTVLPGSTVTFSAVAARVCGNGQINCNTPTPDKVTYQWFYFGSPIPGATTNTLTITNVQAGLVGLYSLQISTPWQTNASEYVSLQLNATGGAAENVQAMNKFLDSADSNPLFVGTIQSSPAIGNGPEPLATVVSGYTGTQTFNTGGSGSTPTETICGVIGGSSQWLTFVPLSSGTLALNTSGSSFATVMAAFRRNPTNSALLQVITCDVNSGTNSTSAVNFPVTAGQTNYVEVDGVNGVNGVLQLNYSLLNGAVLKSFSPVPPQMSAHLQVVGLPNMHFTIQASTNLVNWVPVLTTNSSTGIYDFVDPASPNMPRRFYRALMLP